MSRKFLFTDLDLTLLTKDKRISDKDLDAIDRFLGEGNLFAFVTGRPFEDTVPIAERFSLLRKGFFIASFNGALISSFDGSGWNTVFEEPVSIEDTRFIFEEAEKKKVFCQTYTEKNVVALHDDPFLESYTSGKTLKPLLMEDLDSLLKYLPHPPFKVVCAALNDRPKLEDFRKYITPMISDRLFSLFSSDRLLEFGRLSATKAHALEYLAEYTGTAIEDTVSAGDEANDISMIEAAGTGYAVSNARDEVKSVADRVTVNDNDHGAIAEIIEKILRFAQDDKVGSG